MSSHSRDQYLENKINNASQPELHMMLLDGAIRHGTKALEMWEDGDSFVQVDLMLAKMTDILDEVTHAVANGTETVSKQFEEQYAFIYRELIAARFNENVQKLQSCLELLKYKRETWQMACEKWEQEKVHTESKPTIPHIEMNTDLPAQSFSFEA